MECTKCGCTSFHIDMVEEVYACDNCYAAYPIPVHEPCKQCGCTARSQNDAGELICMLCDTVI